MRHFVHRVGKELSTRNQVNMNGHTPVPLAQMIPSLLTTGRQTESLLTVEEVAELLKVPVSWVYERTRRRSIDRIPGFRLGKYWRFREADVLAWINRQRVGGGAVA